MPEGLRDQIERYAEQRGISMNAAIIGRLQDSFGREQAIGEAIDSAMGGPVSAILLKNLVAAAKMAELRERRGPWHDDYKTFRTVEAAWEEILKRFAPKPDKELSRRVAGLKALKARALARPSPPEPLTGTGEIMGHGLLGQQPRITEGDLSVYWKRIEEYESRMALVLEMEHLVKEFEELDETGREIAHEVLQREGDK
jgi:hypothetical protein